MSLRAQEIVRALAKACPTKNVYSRFCDEPAEHDHEECFFCEIEVDEHTPAARHASTCAYRLAVEENRDW